MTWKLRTSLAAIALLAMAFASGTAHADQITYTITGTFITNGSGANATLNGTSLTGDTITITATGDTSGGLTTIVGGAPITTNPVTATASIDGTVYTFDGSVFFAVNSASGNAGIINLPSNAPGPYNDILFNNSAFVGWNDLTALTIAAGTTANLAASSWSMDSGADTLAIPSGTIDWSFSAVVNSPEPSSLLLLAIGLLGLGVVACWRRNAANSAAV